MDVKKDCAIGCNMMPILQHPVAIDCTKKAGHIIVAVSVCPSCRKKLILAETCQAKGNRHFTMMEAPLKTCGTIQDIFSVVSNLGVPPYVIGGICRYNRAM